MSTGSRKKRRIDRVTSLELPPGVLGNLWDRLRSGRVLVRLALCALAAALLWVVTKGWAPPLGYHLGDVPGRDVVARTQFEKEDPLATTKAREQARSLAIAVYDQNGALLEQQRAKLENDVSQLLAAKDFSEVSPLWNEFRLPLAEGTPEPTDEQRQQQFEAFRRDLAETAAFDKFKSALNDSMIPLIQNGIIDRLPEEHNANVETIEIHPSSSQGFQQRVPVSDVLTESVLSKLQKSLQEKMPTREVADRAFAWLKPNLPVTLKLNVEATQAQQDEAAKAVVPQKEV
ncbi:MAG: hypothetical protein WD468_05965, partial [Pirellulales bacterium]